MSDPSVFFTSVIIILSPLVIRLSLNNTERCNPLYTDFLYSFLQFSLHLIDLNDDKLLKIQT